MNAIDPAAATATSTDKNTLFVRKLPFATTNQELQEYFSAFGPLRSCFVVTKKEDQPPPNEGTSEKKDQNLGFGFVNFVQKEDAEKAMQEVQKTKFKGWKLKVEFAIKKSIVKANPPLEKVPKKQPQKAKIVKKISKSTQKPQTAGKTWKVVVANLPAEGMTKKILFKKMKKFGSPLSIEFFPETCQKALVEYALKAEAERAYLKLNGHLFKGLTVEAHLQEHDKCHKLIIRNLPFTLNLEQLKEKLLQFGPLKDCVMPCKAEDGKKKGFAIVQFEEKAAAVACLAQMNGMKLHKRPVAVDWCLPKDAFEKIEAGASVEKDESDAESEDGTDESESEDEASHSEDDSQSDSESHTALHSEDSDTFFNLSESESSQPEESEVEEEEEQEDQRPKKKFTKKPIQTFSNFTCFIRNLSFDATEQHLLDKFSQFGELNYAKIVVDKETSIPKGTAFINFKTEEAYNACLEACALPEQPQTASGHTSLIMDDTQGISILGRTLHVFPAVDRETASALPDIKAQQEEARSKDRRNLFLLAEGHIGRNSKQAIEGEYSEKDLALHEASFRERQAKLKNSKFFISKTRISLRNLSLALDEKALKTILLQASCRPFHLKQVKIVRSKDRKDLAGNFRSCGFGFVEFLEHKVALATLRYLNEHSARLFGKSRRPIIEFAVENSAILKQRQEKKASLPAEDKVVKAANNEKVEKGKNGKTDKTEKSKMGKDRIAKGGIEKKKAPRPIGFNMSNKKRALLAKELVAAPVAVKEEKKTVALKGKTNVAVREKKIPQAVALKEKNPAPPPAAQKKRRDFSSAPKEKRFRKK